MAALAQAEANDLLKASLAITTYPAPTGNITLALTTTTGTASAAGTEVTGGSYARQTLTGNFGTATNGSVSTNAAINFTNMPAATTTAAEVFDSAGTPKRKWFGALAASKTTGAGDTLSFPSGRSPS